MKPSLVRLAVAGAAILACRPGTTPPASSGVAPTPAQAEGDAPALVDADVPPYPEGASRHVDITQGWWMEPTGDGRTRIFHDGAELGTLSYHFWGKDWAYEGGFALEGGFDGDVALFTMDVPKMGLKVNGRVARSGPGQLQTTLTMLASREVVDVVGGAIQFELKLDRARELASLGPPRVASDRSGWTWASTKGSDAIVVEHDPPLAQAYVPPGEPHLVRALMFTERLAAGTHVHTMTVTLPKGGKVRPAAALRYDPVDDETWYEGSLDWDRSPVDLEYLNDESRTAPLPRARIDGTRLRWPDGGDARFWGTNVVAYAVVQGDPDDMCRQAERLADFGFNLIRLTHLDPPWLEPNLFEPKGSTRKLNDGTLDRLDLWVKCLHEHGVHVWLDMHIGRQFRKADKIDAYPEVQQHRGGQAEGLSFVNPSIEKRMAEFTQQYLGRSNRYTGRRYADDPGIVGVLLTNENNLTHHFGNRMNPRAGHPKHREMMKKAAADFIAAHGYDAYTSIEAWRLGDAKVLMNELEHRWFFRARNNLESLGYRGLVAASSFWGDESLYSVPSLTTGNVIDVHGYGDEFSLESNPRVASTWVHFIAAAHVEGMPLTVTEWNVPAPARDHYVGPLWIAAIASLQGWDALMHYAYNADPTQDPWEPTPWSSLADPSSMAMMPAAAIAYREQHIAPAAKTYRLVFDNEAIYSAFSNPDTLASIRTLAEQSRVVISLPDHPHLDWDTPRPATKGAIDVHDLERSFLPDEGTVVRSDTGEIARDWGKGILTVDTPKSQWAVGWLGGEVIELQDVRVALATAHAALAVTSMDGKPIRESDHLLVSTTGRVVKSDNDRGVPLRAQPVEGVLRIAGDADRPLVLQPLAGGSRNAIARRPGPVRGVYDGTGWTFALPAEVPTHWYTVRPAAG